MANEVKDKSRMIYGIIFVVILIAEIYIALFVRDRFIRPYVGDMLVTLLIGCFLRVFILDKLRLMPVYVFLFACLVEIGQYFDFVELLGFADNKFLSIILGRSFAIADIICYAIGCLAFAALDYVVKKKKRGVL